MKKPMHFNALSKNFGHAKDHRNKPTKAEETLWEELRNKKIDGFRFRFQHPLAYFIVDFYCHQAKLVIEVDGDYHFEEQQLNEDIRRTNVLLDLGCRELRFTNHQVMTDIAMVIETIRLSLNDS